MFFAGVAAGDCRLPLIGFSEDFSAEKIEASFKALLAEKELGFGAVLPNFRLAVTGLGMGPSMFQISALLGKEEVLARIKTAINKIQK